MSAYKPRILRPGYEAVLDAVRSASVDGVLVWRLDRLVRRPAEFERFWSECERAGVFLASATEPIDTSTELGLALVRILVTFAGLESTAKSERVRAASRAAALKGRPQLGGARPFGFTAGWTGHVPAEAALIREAAARLLSGESVGALVRNWHARGVRSVNGRPFSLHTIRDLMLQPRLWGERTYKGVVVADGTWPPILDKTTGARLKLLFAQDGRGRHPTNRVHLLSGLLRCGKCGEGLYVRTRDGRRAYACMTPPRGCGGTSIEYDPVERLVTAESLRYLAFWRPVVMRPSRWKVTGRGDDMAIVAARSDDVRRAARDFYVHHSITRPEYNAVRDAAFAAVGKAVPEQSRDGVRAALNMLGGKGANWPNLNTEERRAVLVKVIDHITIHAARRHSGKFHAERVEIVWVGGSSFRPASATRFVAEPRVRRVPDRLVTGRDAARDLKLAEQTVQRWCREGYLPAMRDGKRWSIRQGDLDDFIESRRII
jgi:excisionase family DNA binding protein